MAVFSLFIHFSAINVDNRELAVALYLHTIKTDSVFADEQNFSTLNSS